MILRKNPLDYTNGKYFSIPDEQTVPRQILPSQIRRGTALYGWLCPELLTVRVKLAVICDDMKKNSGHTQTRAVKPVIYTSGSVIPFNVCYIEFWLLVFNV